MKRRLFSIKVALISTALSAGSAFGQTKYDPGASDREIKIGHINPYSGLASAYRTIRQVQRSLV